MACGLEDYPSGESKAGPSVRSVPEGEPSYLSEGLKRLGHSVVATTLGLYVQVTDDAHRRAADAVAALLD